MNLYKIARLIFSAAIICGACACQKESLKDTDDNVNNKPVGQVELSFDFLKGSVEMDSRATNQPEEEGKVNSLLYAVFKDGVRKHFNYVSFNNKPKQTGESYSILNLSSDWFNTTTEVFALANVDEKLQTLKDSMNIKSWRELTYTAGLNDVAGKNDSRVVDNPVMAGYLNLKDGVTDKISVKLERVYSRIWFKFTWQNHPLAQKVTIDEIKISGLNKCSRLFNCYQYLWQDTAGIKKEIKEEYKISNNDERQLPFIGKLETPYMNENGGLNLDFIEKLESEYNILCRFPWKNNQVDKIQSPVKYYVYSLQRAGTSLEQDPLIVLKYHYDYQSSETVEMTLYKKATARLYDKISEDGKKHHGLLRNYNYRLNCIVNTITNAMELQVVSVPWYPIEINDIPSFE